MKTICAAVAALLAASLLTAASPPAGATGRVVDEQGKPVPGARVCTAGAAGIDLCDKTNLDGRYAVPASEERSIRIVAHGFLPATVPAAARTEPVVLSRAASLHVRLVEDGTGAALQKGQVVLEYTSGKKVGPFPANSKGVSIATLPPGDARPVGSAEGYQEASAPAVKLEAGKSSEVTVRLRKKAGDAKP